MPAEEAIRNLGIDIMIGISAEYPLFLMRSACMRNATFETGLRYENEHQHSH
jgi:hypothetical protein